MDEKIVEMRKREILDLYKYAKTLSQDSEEYGKVMEHIDLMTKQIQAETQIENDKKRVGQEKLDILLKAAVGVGGIAVTGILKYLFGKAAFKFEENGTISTFVGKIFLNGILRDR